MDLVYHFYDEKVCYQFLKKVIWKDDKSCPHCNSNKITEFKTNFKKCRCQGCNKDFSILKDTLFDNSKLPLKKWFMAIYLLSSNKKGLSSIQLGEQIGVTQKTAWYMMHRIRNATERSIFGDRFDKTIEVDEAYIGGKEKNRHMKDRVKGQKQKNIVLGMIERESKNVKVVSVDKATVNDMQSVIMNNVERDTAICSDSHKGYGHLWYFYNHEIVNHDAYQYVKMSKKKSFVVHTNTIEGFWAILKKGINGIYHWVSKKHIQKYMNEFSFRYNVKDLDTNEKFMYFFENLGFSKLSYQKLIS